jgi:hypothetical protein
LWIHHPNCSPEIVDDVVSTRDLFGLLKAVGLNEDLGNTFLSASYRAQNPIALAEHFYYPHIPDILPRYKRNLAAAIAWPEKAVVRGTETVRYDLSRDGNETEEERSSADSFASKCRGLGIDSDATARAVEHLRASATRG